MVVVYSLGRRVLLDWIANEIRSKVKLDYDPEIFPIVNDHVVLSQNGERLYSGQKGTLVRGRLVAGHGSLGSIFYSGP